MKGGPGCWGRCWSNLARRQLKNRKRLLEIRREELKKKERREG